MCIIRTNMLKRRGNLLGKSSYVSTNYFHLLKSGPTYLPPSPGYQGQGWRSLESSTSSEAKRVRRSFSWTLKGELLQSSNCMLSSSDAKIADCGNNILQDKNTFSFCKVTQLLQESCNAFILYQQRLHSPHLHWNNMLLNVATAAENEAQGVHNNY